MEYKKKLHFTQCYGVECNTMELLYPGSNDIVTVEWEGEADAKQFKEMEKLLNSLYKEFKEKFPFFRFFTLYTFNSFEAEGSRASKEQQRELFYYLQDKYNDFAIFVDGEVVTIKVELKN